MYFGKAISLNEKPPVSLAILTRIILGNLIVYPLKILCPIVKSKIEYNAGLVLVYPVNKYVYRYCVLLKNSNKLNKNI